MSNMYIKYTSALNNYLLFKHTGLCASLPPAVNRCRELQTAARHTTLNDKELLQGSPAFSLEKHIRHFKYSNLGCLSDMLICDTGIRVKFIWGWHSIAQEHLTWIKGRCTVKLPSGSNVWSNHKNMKKQSYESSSWSRKHDTRKIMRPTEMFFSHPLLSS